MTIDPARIVNRHPGRYKQQSGEVLKFWIIGVVPEGQPMPAPFETFLANANGDKTLAVKRFRAGLVFYLALDRDGQKLIEGAPAFQYPESCMKHRMLRRIYMPDGIPDVLPAYDASNPHAKINPVACQPSKSDDPVEIAKWWFTWHRTDFPHDKIQLMQKADRTFLVRTEPVPDGVHIPKVQGVYLPISES